MNTIQMRVGKWCVYTHSADGVVFYVGKGRGYRPFEIARRNEYWNEFVSRHQSYEVRVVKWCDTNSEALALEAREITRLAPCCNRKMLTSCVTEHQRQVASKTHKGKQVSAATREKISLAMQGCKPWNTGRTLSDEHKAKIRSGRKPCPVLCTTNGVTYESSKTAAKTLGIPWSTMRAHMKGKLSHARGNHFEYAA